MSPGFQSKWPLVAFSMSELNACTVCECNKQSFFPGTEVTMTTVEGEIPMIGEMSTMVADTTEMTGPCVCVCNIVTVA